MSYPAQGQQNDQDNGTDNTNRVGHDLGTLGFNNPKLESGSGNLEINIKTIFNMFR